MASALDAESEANAIVKRAQKNNNLEEDIEDCQNDHGIERTDKDGLFEQVFSNYLLLKEILKQLDFEDLLSTSLLNKHWNFFAQEILHQNGKCLVTIYEEHCYVKFRRLNVEVSNFEKVNFNGISILVPRGDPIFQSTIHEDPSEMVDNILKKLVIKYLSIDFAPGSTFASVDDFIRQIILCTASSLDGLCLLLDANKYACRSFTEFFDVNLQGQWLPSLRFLKISTRSDPTRIPTRMIKELVEATLKLQIIRGHMNAECLEFIIPLNLSKAVKEFYFRPRRATLKNCEAFAQENLALHKFSFSTFDRGYADRGNRGYADRGNRGYADRGNIFSCWDEARRNKVAKIAKYLLNNSKDSLEEVAFDHSDLILMTHQWEIPVLEKVTQLNLMYSSNIDRIEGNSTLRKIQWEHYFPNLKQVCLGGKFHRYYRSEAYIGNTFRESNANFVCQSVIKFYWTSDFGNAGKIQMFVSIFPNVKEFYLKGSTGFMAVLNELWTAWTDLETIYLSVGILSSLKNYDSDFFGISEEEAVYLRENVKELESLEIVSTKPSIFKFKRLKKLVIHVAHDQEHCVGIGLASNSAVLSRLAFQCAFSRIRGLVVEIHRDLCTHIQDQCDLTLEHLEPFAKLVECKCGVPDILD